jgi:hypothetical protein
MAGSLFSPSIEDCTDECIESVDKIVSWFRVIKSANGNQRDLVIKRLSDELEFSINNSQDFQSEFLKRLTDLINSAEPDETTAEMTSNDSSRKLLLNFNLSRSPEGLEKFKEQLTTFFWERRFEYKMLTRDGVTLNKTVTKQITDLMKKLQNGAEIHGLSDFDKHFNQDYIAEIIAVFEDQIAWHGEENMEETRGNVDWVLPWRKRRVYNLKAVFRQLHLSNAEPNEYSFMPPVYVRIKKSGWHCTKWTSSGDSNVEPNPSFPDWIINDTEVGNQGSEVNLFNFLHEAHEFETDNYLKSRNIVYYFVIKNEVRCSCELDAGKCKKCRSSAVQIYIGKSANVIDRRWLTDRWAHCKAARQLFDMKTGYSFPRFFRLNQSVSLFDIHLALAYLKQWPTALFIVSVHKDKTEMENAEAMLIREHAATEMRHGLNCKEEHIKA